MLFNSHVFLFAFLPAVLFLWYLPRSSPRIRLAVLTAASYVFYGYWDWRFTTLMMFSTVVDHVAGARIHAATSPAVRRRWLVASLFTNLGLLAVFKYAGFASRSANALAVMLTGTVPFSVPEIVLPVGISFYTFQSMSYTIDIYRGKARPVGSFLEFAAFVSMFPQLVAGPIVRFTELSEQLRNLVERPRWSRFRSAIHFFVLGLAKKVLVADPIAARIDPLLAGFESLDFFTAWLAMTGYAMQIYFDFSGYSDMAVGLGHALGFRFPQNFDSPYKAVDVSDFWRRWHISLSLWLRDYLYISLGGNRGGNLKTLRNLVITMGLGGLWHGASWTFCIWGLLHGLYLCLHHLWRRRERPLPVGLGRALTFLAVVVGWVFFRSQTFPMAARILEAMAGLKGLGLASASSHLVLLGLTGGATALSFFSPNTWEVSPEGGRARAALLAALFTLCVLRLSQPSPFLYFQF